jgi:hypothetical protein
MTASVQLKNKITGRESEGACLQDVNNSASYELHSGFLLNLFFDPENGGDVFLRNID